VTDGAIDIRVFRTTSVAKFLSKKLFEPDIEHINPLIRYTFTPVGFWLNTYKLDYIVGVARKG
jgi:hypothetical protein